MPCPPPQDGEGTHMEETHRVPRGHLGAFHFCPRIKMKNPWRGGASSPEDRNSARRGNKIPAIVRNEDLRKTLSYFLTKISCIYFGNMCAVRITQEKVAVGETPEKDECLKTGVRR